MRELYSFSLLCQNRRFYQSIVAKEQLHIVTLLRSALQASQSYGGAGGNGGAIAAPKFFSRRACLSVAMRRRANVRGNRL